MGNKQLPIEVIPMGFYCYQILKVSQENQTVDIKICPYLMIDTELNTKKCCFLEDMEIVDFKECQINMGVV